MKSSPSWAVELEARAAAAPDFERLQDEVVRAQSEVMKWRRLHLHLSTTFAYAVGVLGFLVVVELAVILWLHGRLA